MEKREYYNALFEACYYDQIIDEACNGDMSYNNYFRRTLTVQDCINAAIGAKAYAAYAKEA